MLCPVCEHSRMREVEKNGILIDVCPICKGVWLDRGELDKLMKDVREVRDEYNQWHYGSNPGSSTGSSSGTSSGYGGFQSFASGNKSPGSQGGHTNQGSLYNQNGSYNSYGGQYGSPQGGSHGSSHGGSYSNPKHQSYPPNGGQAYRDKHYGSHHSGHHGSYPYKKKKSVLDVFGDLFD